MTSEGPHIRSNEEWLTGYVAERDVECPRCSHNLRNLRSTKCPECGEELILRVGLRDPQIIGLILTLFPLMGSGVAGLMLAAMILAWGGPPSGVIMTALILLFGGVLGLVLLRYRRWFLRFQIRTQLVVAAILWLVHILGWAVFVAKVR